MGLLIDADPALGIPLRDPEDGVAILYALASGAEVEGVTVCFGNVPLPRALRAARRTVRKAGRAVPVLAGASGPLDLGRPTEASRFLAESIRGGAAIAAIAPPTNIATAFRREPRLARKIRRLVVMGGMVRGRWRFLPDFLQAEFNFWKDPRAAAEVLATGRALLVPAEVCLKALCTPADLRRLGRGGPVARWLAGQLTPWLVLCSSAGWLAWPGVGPGAGFPMWDSLAVAVALDPSLVKTERMRLRVRTDPLRRGQVAAGEGSVVEVAVDADVPRFKERVLGTLQRE